MAEIKFQQARKRFLILPALCAIRAACAAVPLEWIATPQRPAPATFDRFHGESLVFRCTFTGFGALPFAAGEDVRLWYQTNGMGAAWWSVPATVSSNMISAVWGPSADPGAERLTVFFGAPSNAYAAAQVRFRNSPGATPNNLTPPSILDWQSSLSAATNTLTHSYSSQLSNASQSATNYTDEAVSELKTDLQNGSITVADAAYATEASNAHAAASASSAYSLEDIDEYGGTRTTAQIFAQLDSASHITTNDVCNIVTNREFSYSFMALDGTKYEITNFGFTETTATGILNGVAFSLLVSHFDDGDVYSFYVHNVPPNRYTVQAGTADVGFPKSPDEWGSINVGDDYDNEYYFEKHGVDLGLARLHDITNTVTKAYIESLGIEVGISAEDATNIAESVVNATVTGVVRSVAHKVANYMWDGDVCWRREPRLGGYIEFVAVTNIDVTLPENYEALEALERRDNQ